MVYNSHFRVWDTVAGRTVLQIPSKTASVSYPQCAAFSADGKTLYIGDEKGFFRDEGIDLKIQFIESYDSRRAALVAGQIHVDCTTLDQLLIYADNGVDAQVYGLSDFSQGGDGIVAKKNITSSNDLRGKTVAYAEATPSEFLLRWILRRYASESTKEEAAPAPAGRPLSRRRRPGCDRCRR